MKRGIFETLKRGFENTIANWPIILLRFGEMILFGILAILTAIAIVVPILVSIGIRVMDLHTPDDFESAMLSMMQAWSVLLWIFLAVLVLIAVFTIVHSFVEAGCARVYVDADRIGGPQDNGPRQRYEVFSMERWLAGGKDGWWSVFWIYNLAWGLAGLVLLIPLLPTAVLMLVFRENPPIMLGSGCVGLAATALLMVVVGIITAIWTTRAIAEWAAHRDGARAALAKAWRSIKTDFGRQFVITLAVIVVAVAGSSVFSSFSFFAAFGDAVSRHSVHFITLPIRVIAQLLSSLFSSAIASWALASYCALAVEDRS